MAVGRFQVMAVLQAARALVLGLPESQAKSWGLNRAIFYAAAKRGFKAKPQAERSPGEAQKKPEGEAPKKKEAAEDIVVFGGGIIPEDDIPELKKMGVDEVFGPGTPTSSLVEYLQKKFGKE